MDAGIVTVVVFTGAPEAADYSALSWGSHHPNGLGAKTVETFEAAAYPGAPLKTWRKVIITNTAGRVAYQCDRYRSFLGGCPTLDDPRVVGLGEGRQAPTNFL